MGRKGISTVMAVLLMILITVAGAITTWLWLAGYIGDTLTSKSITTDALSITNCAWAPDCSYVDLTVKNTGDSEVIIDAVHVDNQPVTTFTFVSGDSALIEGETAVLRVFYDFTSGAEHNLWVITTAGTKFSCTTTVPDDSVTMEWGTITVNDTFREVSLQNNYASPVVVCTPRYTSGVPRTVRLANVTSQSFLIRVQNPSSAVCPNTTVNFLVVEEGVWTTPLKLEARRYSTNTVGQDSNWAYDTRYYGQTYSGNIVVFHQIMSYDDPEWITTYVSKMNSRTQPPSSGDDGFRIALNGAEASDSHENETIGYVIFEQGSGTIGGVKYEVKRTTDSVGGFSDSPPYNTDFSQSFTQTPAVSIAAQLEMDGGNGGWVVTYSLSQTQAGLMVDEDQGKDSERNHITETCGFIAFETEGAYST